MDYSSKKKRKKKFFNFFPKWCQASKYKQKTGFSGSGVKKVHFRGKEHKNDLVQMWHLGLGAVTGLPELVF
jgi:hypothetical protein